MYFFLVEVRLLFSRLETEQTKFFFLVFQALLPLLNSEGAQLHRHTLKRNFSEYPSNLKQQL